MKRLSLIIITLFFSLNLFAVDIGGIIGSAVTGAKQLSEAAKEITPAEEHYIGRAVAAIIISKNPIVRDHALTKYLNDVGLVVAYSSSRPITYGGYHFAILNSDEPNAFACPGGIILVNKGLLKHLKNEDQLAAVLAHEVAHVANRDGIKAIKKDKWTKFAFYAAGEVGKHYSSDEVGQLVGEFKDVVGDVAKKVMESGYSKSDEKNADVNGMSFLQNAGYDPNAMTDVINSLSHVATQPSGPFSSHPKAEVRIQNMGGASQYKGVPGSVELRTKRFQTALSSIARHN